MSLIHPEDRDRAAEAAAAAMRGGPRYDVEYRVVRPDGTVRVVHSQGDVARDESGRPVRQFGVMQDITELRRAEDELRATEAYLEEAQRLSHTGSWALDLVSNKYIYTSDESDRIYGVRSASRTHRPGKPSSNESTSRGSEQLEAEFREIAPRESETSPTSTGSCCPTVRVRHIRAIRAPRR